MTRSQGPTRRAVMAFGAAAVAGLPRLSFAQTRAVPPPPGEPKGQVIVGLSQEPTKFNPHFPAIEVDQGVWMQVFSPLWMVDPTGDLLPRLAKEIPTVANGGVSPDGLTWRIRLREGVKWHDGAPFGAEDVKFTLDLINNKDFAAGSRTGHNLVRDIQVVSPTELTWRMERAYAPYLAILAWTFIVPKHVLGTGDPNTAPFNNAPIGTGPFRWGERVAGDHITLLANKDYFGPGPYLERLIFKYIPDLTVMYTQFRTGEIDQTGLQGITPDHYDEAKTLAGRVISTYSTAAIETIAPNLEHPALRDKAVRQALYAAINKKAITDAIYYGLPKPTESFLPRESWAFNPDLPVQEYNPAKANKLLDDAGWVRGSDGIRVKGGVRLEFANSTTAGNHVREQAQQLLMQDWKAIGAAMTINNMPAAVIWADFWRLSRFDSLMVGTTYMMGADPEATDRFSSAGIPAKGGSGKNVQQYVNPRVDELLKAGVTTFDQDKRRKIYQEIQALVREDVVFLPLFQYTNVQGIKEGLIGYKPNPNTLVNTWNCETWYWAK